MKPIVILRNPGNIAGLLSLRKTKAASGHGGGVEAVNSLKGKRRSLRKKFVTPLERATKAFFENMTEDELRAERELEHAITGSSKGIEVGRDE